MIVAILRGAECKVLETVAQLLSMPLILPSAMNDVAEIKEVISKKEISFEWIFNFIYVLSGLYTIKIGPEFGLRIKIDLFDQTD